MVKLDHLTIRVRDLPAARHWYVTNLGLGVEFEVPGRATVALQGSIVDEMTCESRDSFRSDSHGSSLRSEAFEMRPKSWWEIGTRAA